MPYSKKVMEHFSKPRNVGGIKDADGIGKVGNPVCGDIMEFYIKVKDNRLEDIKFKTFGCGATIAVSSMISEMATGKTIEEALKITNKDVADELDGLPQNKLHCSNLGADALHEAIKDYLNKTKQKKSEEQEKEGETDDKNVVEKCSCPYCDEPMENEAVCSSCGKLCK